MSSNAAKSPFQWPTNEEFGHLEPLNIDNFITPTSSLNTAKKSSTNTVPHQRQHSSADSSYNSDDDDDGEGADNDNDNDNENADDDDQNVFCASVDLAKIVGDIVDSGSSFDPSSPKKGTVAPLEFSEVAFERGNDSLMIPSLEHFWQAEKEDKTSSSSSSSTKTLTLSSLLHEEINRTTSETLSQEYSEWSNSPNSRLMIESAQNNHKFSEDFASSHQPDFITVIEELLDDEKDNENENEIENAEKLSQYSVNSEGASSNSGNSFYSPVASVENLSTAVVQQLSTIDLSNPERAELYAEKLKYSQKLGYTESQVALAVEKVGIKAAKNDFLNALICIGATTAPTATNLKDQVFNNSVEQNNGLQKFAPSDLQLANFEIVSKSIPPAVVQQQQQPSSSSEPQLRPIVIDGSNVAIR